MYLYYLLISLLTLIYNLLRWHSISRAKKEKSYNSFNYISK